MFKIGESIVYIKKYDDDFLYVYDAYENYLDQKYIFCHLTYHKIYKVQDDSDINYYDEEKVCIINDKGEKILAVERDFISLKKFRKQKLIKIENDNKKR